MLRDGGHYVEALNAVNPTYLNGVPVEQPGSISHGDYLQAGQTRFQFLLRPAGKDTIQKAPPLPVAGQSGQGTATLPGMGDPLEGRTFPVGDGLVIGREQERVHVYLPHPQVSRLHASLALQGTQAIVTDLNSANGTFVNGQRIHAATALAAGDQLDIGPYSLQFTGQALIPRPRSDNVELVGRRIKRTVQNRETGEPLLLLEDINLVIRPREFVCLLGPSGSGKSTLLSVLSGRVGAR